MDVLHPLSTESENQLLERWQRRGDESAREELVRRFLPLVRNLARRYSYTSEPIDDLVQVGSVGLLHALARYDPEVGSSFKAFAVPTIVGELRRHFRDRAWSVHLPRSLQERTRAVQVAVSELSGLMGRSPAIAEIAEHIDATSEQVIEAMEARFAYRVESLDAPANTGDERENWRSAGEEDPGYAAAEDAATIARAMNALPPRELALVKLRFEDDLSQSEIGKTMGLSQMHVSRLLRRALSRMQAIATSERALSAQAFGD